MNPNQDNQEQQLPPQTPQPQSGDVQSADSTQMPKRDDISQRGGIDYNDPHSPPPPIVVELEEKYANIPANQQIPTTPNQTPINTNVNWDDPKPNAGDHHAKGLFIVGMIVVVTIIVGLASFLVFNSMKKPKQVSSTQKSTQSNQIASNKDSTANQETATDNTDTTDYGSDTPAGDFTDGTYTDSYSDTGSDGTDTIPSEGEGDISPNNKINNPIQINKPVKGEIPDLEDKYTGQ